ncbi:MAG: phosphate ABC transporter permease subunit PstC [Acidobacteria bacterium]|nr:phosphate ABC transporter permease subunit PstC [Acidobacteriota bacterium]
MSSLLSPTRAARRSRLADRLWSWLTRGSGILVLALLVGIFGELTLGAWPALRSFGLGFFTSQSWNPVTEEFGGLTSIYGTLVTSALALALAVPVSFGIAFFLAELCPGWLKRPLGTAVELLATIPSIVYGMWGLFVFAPFLSEHVQPRLTAWTEGIPGLEVLFGGPPIGIGLFTASLILAIMILPLVASVMRDVFEAVPATLKESAYALGATTWEVVWKVVVPHTRVGLVGAAVLGLGRALGETMAVTFVIGNAHNVSPSLFLPGGTISSTLANEFTEAVSEIHTSSLLALGWALFVLTAVVLAASRLMLRRLARQEAARP